MVEDSEDDALLVARELDRHGYETYYERVETPEAMRQALDAKHWDVVLSEHEGVSENRPLRVATREVALPMIL